MAVQNSISGFFGGGGGGATPTTDSLQVVSNNGATEVGVDVSLGKDNFGVDIIRNIFLIYSSPSQGNQIYLTKQNLSVGGGYGGVRIFPQTTIYIDIINNTQISISENQIGFNSNGLGTTTLKQSPLGQAGYGYGKYMPTSGGILALNEMPFNGTIDVSASGNINGNENYYYQTTNTSGLIDNITFLNIIPDGTYFWIMNEFIYKGGNYLQLNAESGNIYCPQGTQLIEPFFIRVLKLNGNYYIKYKNI